MILKFPEEQIVAAFHHSKIASSIGIGLKKINLAYVDNNLNIVSLLETDIQKLIIKIQSQKLLINQEIDRYFFYFNKTYDSGISEDNLNRIKKNMKEASKIIFKFSYNMVSEIDNLLPLLEKETSLFQLNNYIKIK